MDCSNEILLGNFKVPHDQQTKIKKFILKHCPKSVFILSLEKGKDGKNEHIHFAIENPEIKPNSFKHYIRQELPELKKDKLGGEKKYCASIMNEEIQYRYLFKETNVIVYRYDTDGIGIQMSNKDIDENRKLYLKLKEEKKGNSKWLAYLSGKSYVPTYASLIPHYVHYAALHEKAIINAFDCEKHCNQIIAKQDPEYLIKIFQQKISPLFDL